MALKVRKNKSPKPPNRCPLTQSLSIIGGAWTPNIVWSLGAGPRRFNELRVDMPRVSAKVLATRLRELEANGIVVREAKATSPPSVEYSLTAIGAELIPAIKAVADVGYRLKQQG